MKGSLFYRSARRGEAIDELREILTVAREIRPPAASGARVGLESGVWELGVRVGSQARSQVVVRLHVQPDSGEGGVRESRDEFRGL